METIILSWINAETGYEHRMHCTHLHPIDSWLAGLRKCGWEQRTSLQQVDTHGYTIRNWWDISEYLPLFSTKNNYQRDLTYLKKLWDKNLM